MTSRRGPRGLILLVAGVAAGTAVVVAVTVALYPGDRPVSAAVPSSSPPGPTAPSVPSVPSVQPSPPVTGSGTDARGCPTAFTAALDDHLLCPPDLGSGWKLDAAVAVRPVSERCAPAGSVAPGAVDSSRVVSMLGPGFDVVEQIRRYASVRDATTAFDNVRLWMLGCTSTATGLDVRDADNEIQPASLSAGYVVAQSWWVVKDRMRTGLVLFESGTTVVEVAVLAHDASSGPPQAALVSVVAHAALQWDTTPPPSAPSPSSTT
jgi:hypothetical protein